MPVRRRRMCKIKPEAHGGTCPQVGSGDRDLWFFGNLKKVIIFFIDINDPCVGIWKHWYVTRQRGPAVHRAGWTVCVQFHIMRSWDLGELTDYWLSPKNQVEQCVLHDAHCLDEKKNEHYGDHFKVNLFKAFIVANIFPFLCFLVSSDQHACSDLSIPFHLFYPFNHSGQWFHILVKTQRLLAIAQVWKKLSQRKSINSYQLFDLKTKT